MYVKHTKYSTVRIFFKIYDPEEWQKEWSKFSQQEKDQILEEVTKHG